MRSEGRGRGAGKLILCGEHAVVYGHPALAFAVELGTEVRLERADGPTSVVSDAEDPRLGEALHTVLPSSGLRVHIASDLPIGRGMGSSAALAVATVRALADLEGNPLSRAECVDRAMPMERCFHGNPSGLDVAAATHGGLIRFTKGPPMALTHLDAPALQIVVMDSGVEGDTARQVARVASRRPAIDSALERIGALTPHVEEHLDHPVNLGRLMTLNHQLLQDLGVSNPELDLMVTLALSTGAYGAKLAGAGGGGVVMALVDDPAPLLDAAAACDIPALATTIWNAP